jgi:antitoxin ParD1/3/4
MATMTISLPDRMKEWVEEQVEAGDYASSSDYLRDLVRRDREEKEIKLEHLRNMIDESFASGTSGRSVDEIFADAVAATKARGTWRE